MCLLGVMGGGVRAPERPVLKTLFDSPRPFVIRITVKRLGFMSECQSRPIFFRQREDHMKTAKSEHRRLERFGLGLPSQVHVSEEKEGEGVMALETRNVCSGGAFFKTEELLAEGTEVAIDLVLPLDELKKMDGRRTLIKVSGIVVRTEDEGMAVQFNRRFKLVPMSSEDNGGEPETP